MVPTTSSKLALTAPSPALVPGGAGGGPRDTRLNWPTSRTRWTRTTPPKILEVPEALHARTGMDQRLRCARLVFAGRACHDGVLVTDVDPVEDILGPVQYSDDVRGMSFAKISCFDSPAKLPPRLMGALGPEVGPIQFRGFATAPGEIFMAAPTRPSRC